jgi:hypothetical protein
MLASSTRDAAQAQRHGRDDATLSCVWEGHAQKRVGEGLRVSPVSVSVSHCQRRLGAFSSPHRIITGLVFIAFANRETSLKYDEFGCLRRIDHEILQTQGSDLRTQAHCQRKAHSRWRRDSSREWSATLLSELLVDLSTGDPYPHVLADSQVWR